MKINWPDSVDEQTFLDKYWQQQPLLIKQAFPEFDNPLDPNELAGLACDDEANSRFMQRVDGNEWRMCAGPLSDDFFDDITGHEWSLLVSDVEKLLPDFRSYLEPFRFLPDWRIDDLMISYAPVGGSVGAHIDQYDVFLLQAAGVREWRIENTPRSGHQPSISSSISLLGDFKADSTMYLQAGDMLYLPPEFAHHGIAFEEPCMTWSIGFRAPSAEEMLPSILRYICDSAGENPLLTNRFTDRQRGASDNPGHISNNDMQRLRSIIRNALTIEDAALDICIGRYLTEPVASEPYELPAPLDWRAIETQLLEQQVLVCNSQVKFATIAANTAESSRSNTSNSRKNNRPESNDANSNNPGSKIASSPVRLLADGDVYDCSEHLGNILCRDRLVKASDIKSKFDRQTIVELVNRQHLLIESCETH